ncbi:ribosomal protein S18 acetylase RimI-like enzyme [Microbacterium resistens]|uniref:Ribosomal protein S18 acetylase RimI-like enzyme n=1 Tax=Microbacterium resistens TaxID=156977 RepID=A0ABU1SB82_9MICO|nr:GNAT family N-acetyltransferase [Microbacterium resistens]MDR6866538.1 ribosomal protein S18 acetylase RimI-like enzyme [Microbacterium resistens]
MVVHILRHLRPQDRVRAAELYIEAFRAKLSPAIGEDGPMREFVAHHLHLDRVLTAIGEDDRLLGLAGLHTPDGPAFDPTYRGLVRATSAASAWWRSLLLAPLHRSPRRGELLLDGLCVDSAARGQGIGSLLLAETADIARERGLTRVSLSVIDTNPRARALYERQGFVAGKVDRMGPFARLYGFSRATAMHLALPPRGPDTSTPLP